MTVTLRSRGRRLKGVDGLNLTCLAKYKFRTDQLTDQLTERPKRLVTFSRAEHELNRMEWDVM
jgi:hypothetical protein